MVYYHKRESLSLFGVMRDATKEEQEGVQKYIDSIAEDTGVSFLTYAKRICLCANFTN